ncbi:MAG: Fur family transcriptional regulator [Proteobacteria bacterium]|nr:Fur family transcriptional regulator [Pseudomonadota bacterium]
MSASESFKNTCIKTLRESGARLTKPRLALIDCLAESRLPLSPKEIYQKTTQQLEDETIDAVTVYRILDRFAELGLVHKVAPDGDYIACTHLACEASPHIMTHCTLCHTASEIHVPEEVMAPVLWFLRNQNHFEPKKHLFQMDGICARCLLKSSPKI